MVLPVHNDLDSLKLHKKYHFLTFYDYEKIITIINSLFKSIPSHIFIKEKEAYYHSIVFLVFQYLGQYIEAEVNTSDGRIDAGGKTFKKLVASLQELSSEVVSPDVPDSFETGSTGTRIDTGNEVEQVGKSIVIKISAGGNSETKTIEIEVQVDRQCCYA